MSVRSKLDGAPHVVRALPWVVRARWDLRRTTDLRVLIAAHDRSGRPDRGRRRSIESVRRGVDGALRVIGPREEHCVPRALALFAMLTRSGHGAELVSGVRRDGPDLRGHAWVEVGGVPVEPPGTSDPRQAYREQIRVVARRQAGG